MSIQSKIADVKARLGFAETAQALALSGSHRGGFDCPACGGRHTLKVRADNKGGRCIIEDCREGFGVIDLAARVQRCGVPSAVFWLERLAAELESGPRAAQPGFFDEG